jgi:hypothetical protein
LLLPVPPEGVQTFTAIMGQGAWRIGEVVKGGGVEVI